MSDIPFTAEEVEASGSTGSAGERPRATHRADISISRADGLPAQVGVVWLGAQDEYRGRNQGGLIKAAQAGNGRWSMGTAKEFVAADGTKIWVTVVAADHKNGDSVEF